MLSFSRWHISSLRNVPANYSSNEKSQFQELEEAQEFCAEAARASQALAKAEAEIELLQQLLKEKEEQVGCLLCVL